MGRGRAKAKQQKVARELKYNTHFTDLDALQRELGVSGAPDGASGRDAPDGDGPAAADDDSGDTGDEFGYRDGAADPDDDYESWTGTDR